MTSLICPSASVPEDETRALLGPKDADLIRDLHRRNIIKDNKEVKNQTLKKTSGLRINGGIFIMS